MDETPIEIQDDDYDLEGHAPFFWYLDNSYLVVRPLDVYFWTEGKIGEFEVDLNHADINCVDLLWVNEKTEAVIVIGTITEIVDSICVHYDCEDDTGGSTKALTAWAEHLEEQAARIRTHAAGLEGLRLLEKE